MNSASLRRAVIPISILALLVFLGRAFYDFRFEAPNQGTDNQAFLYMVIAYLVCIGLWVWAILGAQNQNRVGLIGLIVLNLLLNVVLGILTLVIFCPPGCEGWPTWQFWNTAQIVLGVLAVVVAGMSLRQSGV